MCVRARLLQSEPINAVLTHLITQPHTAASASLFTSISKPGVCGFFSHFSAVAAAASLLIQITPWQTSAHPPVRIFHVVKQYWVRSSGLDGDNIGFTALILSVIVVVVAQPPVIWATMNCCCCCVVVCQPDKQHSFAIQHTSSKSVEHFIRF